MTVAEYWARERVIAGALRFRIENGVNHDVEHVVQHSGKELSEKFVALFQARVCVCFNKDIVQLFIKEKIIAHELKGVILHSYFTFDCFDGVLDDLDGSGFEFIKESRWGFLLTLRAAADVVE